MILNGHPSHLLVFYIKALSFIIVVFGAVSSQAFLYVYDLNVEKHTYLCDQRIVKKTKLTHLAFNLVDPILIVGDDRGGVTSLRLSPNLRGILLFTHF
jgi:dynein intermediate chain 1, axonemal